MDNFENQITGAIKKIRDLRQRRDVDTVGTLRGNSQGEFEFV